MKDLTGADKPVAPKRPRPNNRKNNNTMKTLLGLVAPVVSETVDGFQRDRVADRNAARAAAATTAPSTSHELPVGVSQPNNSINPGGKELKMLYFQSSKIQLVQITTHLPLATCKWEGLATNKFLDQVDCTQHCLHRWRLCLKGNGNRDRSFSCHKRSLTSPNCYHVCIS